MINKTIILSWFLLSSIQAFAAERSSSQQSTVIRDTKTQLALYQEDKLRMREHASDLQKEKMKMNEYRREMQHGKIPMDQYQKDLYDAKRKLHEDRMDMREDRMRMQQDRREMFEKMNNHSNDTQR